MNKAKSELDTLKDKVRALREEALFNEVFDQLDEKSAQFFLLAIDALSMAERNLNLAKMEYKDEQS